MKLFSKGSRPSENGCCSRELLCTANAWQESVRPLGIFRTTTRAARHRSYAGTQSARAPCVPGASVIAAPRRSKAAMQDLRRRVPRMEFRMRGHILWRMPRWHRGDPRQTQPCRCSMQAPARGANAQPTRARPRHGRSVHSNPRRWWSGAYTYTEPWSCRDRGSGQGSHHGTFSLVNQFHPADVLQSIHVPQHGSINAL